MGATDLKTRMQRHYDEARDRNYVYLPLHTPVDDQSDDDGWKKVTTKKENNSQALWLRDVHGKVVAGWQVFSKREDRPWLKMMENSACTIEERSYMQ